MLTASTLTTATAALLLASLQSATAQTFTSCNPLEKTNCPSDPAVGGTQVTDFTGGASGDWSLAAGTTLSYGANGAEFTINTATEAPTVSNDKYIFFGKVDAVVRAAPGQGIVSSFILESDDLDEIDWEWLGSKDTSVESNFFGKGNTTTYDRAVYHNVADPIGTWHTYTVDWTAQYIKWSIDGNLVRTLNYDDPLALYGKNFPQTPMKVKMGNWVGCANAAANQPSSPTYGTCQWAGGPADFSQAPFTMYVKSVTVQDYSCGSEFTYGDTSGSWQSIKVSGSCNGTSSNPTSSGSSSTSASSGSSSASSASSASSGSSGSSSASSVTSVSTSAQSSATGAAGTTTTTGPASTTLARTSSGTNAVSTPSSTVPSVTGSGARSLSSSSFVVVAVVGLVGAFLL